MGLNNEMSKMVRTLTLSASVMTLVMAAGSSALAQSPNSALPVLPSVRILKGPLISPAAAAAHYGSSTASTDGLCRDYSANAGVCPSGTRPRAPEIKELARALRGDPDTIYEYVRNGVDTEFMFGAHKGPLGVIIDRSGTAFDQAELMVELLRESGITASYKFGVVTLTAAQFYDWTGLQNAQAACSLLATGGIPATVTATGGSGGDPSNCAGYIGNVSGVDMAHVWVEATIGAQSYQFDPSYKPYQHLQGVDVRGAMQLSTGYPLAQAVSGMAAGSQSGVAYVSNLNASNLNTTLQSYAASLLGRLDQADLQGAALADAIGGRRIKPADRPVGGWRQATLPYGASVSATWTGGVPDAYRARLTVLAEKYGSPANTTNFNAAFFVDEIYGRRLEIWPQAISNAGLPLRPYNYKPTLTLDGVSLATGQVYQTSQLFIEGAFTADHPFAALGGTYGDAVVQKEFSFLRPASIVQGWGLTSRRLADKWEGEQAMEAATIRTMTVSPDDEITISRDGDKLRARIGATWLSEASTTAEIHAELADSRFVPLHSIGVISVTYNDLSTYKLNQLNGKVGPVGFSAGDEVQVVDVETSFGLVSRTSNTGKRRAAAHAIAATSALLEGSVLEQLMDAPDAASTARRFAWGNLPEVGETPDASPRKVFNYTSANASAASQVSVFENLSSGLQGTFQGQSPIDAYSAGYIKGRLYNTIAAYAGASFDVTASAEALLGPGHRQGTEYTSQINYDQISNHTDYTLKRAAPLQSGGALIANHYDGTGDPDLIAHVLTRYLGASKGGGGSADTKFDPTKAADVLKDRFIDRSKAVGVNLANGTAGFTSPVLESVGSGEFPYKLERRVELRGSGVRFWDEEAGIDSFSGDLDGLVSNWNAEAQISTSASEVTGGARIQASASTLAAFVAMQDVWSSGPSSQREVTGELVADWWGRSLWGNVVTLSQGSASEQYVRLADGRFMPAGGGADTLTVTGARVAVRPTHHTALMHVPGATQKEEVTRVWDGSGVHLSARGGHGEVRDYEFWRAARASDDAPVVKPSGQRLKSWTFPSGVKVTLSYFSGVYDGNGVQLWEPTAVSTNLGLGLALTPVPTMTCNTIYGDLSGQTGLPATDLLGAVTRAVFRSAPTPSVSQRPSSTCDLAEIYNPLSATVPVLRYTYDTTNKIKQAEDAIAIRTPTARQPYMFYVAEGYRAQRVSPSTASYVVETLPAGGLSVTDVTAGRDVSADRKGRVIDELGRVTTSLFDGRGRVLERSYPEGDRDRFRYDASDNVIELRKLAKPGSGLADLVVTAAWDPTWNKPSWIKDARANQAGSDDRLDLTYWPASAGGAAGQIYQAIQPAVVGGRPTWTFAYASNGQIAMVTDPLGMQATTAYDPTGNPIQSVLDAANLSLRSCRVFDAVGNPVSETDPRAASCP